MRKYKYHVLFYRLLCPLQKTPPPPTPFPPPAKENKNHSLSLSVNSFISYCEIFSDFQDKYHRSLPMGTFIANLSSMCSYTQKVLTVLFPSQKMLSCFILINLLPKDVNFVSLYLTSLHFLYDILRCIPWFFKFICVFATAWKLSIFGVILVRIFSYSDRIWKDTEYFSVWSLNAGKNKLDIKTQN